MGRHFFCPFITNKTERNGTETERVYFTPTVHVHVYAYIFVYMHVHVACIVLGLIFSSRSTYRYMCMYATWHVGLASCNIVTQSAWWLNRSQQVHVHDYKMYGNLP